MKKKHCPKFFVKLSHIDSDFLVCPGKVCGDSWVLFDTSSGFSVKRLFRRPYNYNRAEHWSRLHSLVTKWGWKEFDDSNRHTTNCFPSTTNWYIISHKNWLKDSRLRDHKPSWKKLDFKCRSNCWKLIKFGFNSILFCMRRKRTFLMNCGKVLYFFLL